jgi:nitroreductase/FMN reductase [NAD(P)H]
MSLNADIQKRFGLPTETGKTVESNQTLDLIFNHRSVREFSDQLVDEDLMRTLLAAAFCCPSKSDLQQARVLWIRDPEIKKAIADLSPELHPWIATAPEFLIWCGDNSVCHGIAETHGHPYVNNHLDQFMNPAVDAGIAMATFLWAATSKGLRCCPVSSIRNTPRELADILKLPKLVFPVAGLVVGYPCDGEEGVISMKLPPTVTIMENEYRQDGYDILKDVEDYSRRRTEAQPQQFEKQRAEPRFGRSEEYGWSEDKARQYGLFERANWGEFIRSQGFKLD